MAPYLPVILFSHDPLRIVLALALLLLLPRK